MSIRQLGWLRGDAIKCDGYKLQAGGMYRGDMLDKGDRSRSA